MVELENVEYSTCSISNFLQGIQIHDSYYDFQHQPPNVQRAFHLDGAQQVDGGGRK